MSDLTVNSEYERLKSEVDQLKKEVSKLILTRDELIYHTCKNIEAEYWLKIGVLEHKLFEYYCNCLRLKRKISLVQSKINRQEIIFLLEIDEQLNNEFKEYKDRLNEQEEAINNALNRSNAYALTPEEEIELKKKYREIVKSLHPDLNPNATENQLILFNKAVEAYENADIETIRTIYIMIDGISDDNLMDGLDRLKEKKYLLLKKIDDINNHINEIKNSFPYNQKEFLEDDEAVAARIKEYQEQLDNYKAIYQELEKKLDKILGGE